MSIQNLSSWCAVGKEVSVRAESCRSANDQKGDVEGFERSWRRSQVLKINAASKTVRIVTCSRQPIYDDEDDTQLDNEPFDGYDKVPTTIIPATADSPEERYLGYDDRQWDVALQDLRPWAPFLGSNLWSKPTISSFQEGDQVIYEDGKDSCTDWIAYVQRVFKDGLWLYVQGPPRDAAVLWNTHEHHCLVCVEKTAKGRPHPKLDSRQTLQYLDADRMPYQKRIFSIDRHLRKDRTFDVMTGKWTNTPPPKRYYNRAYKREWDHDGKTSIFFFPEHIYDTTLLPAEPDTAPKGPEPVKSRPAATPKAVPISLNAAPQSKQTSLKRDRPQVQERRGVSVATVRKKMDEQGMLIGSWDFLQEADKRVTDSAVEVMHEAVLKKLGQNTGAHKGLQLLEGLNPDVQSIVDDLLVSTST